MVVKHDINDVVYGVGESPPEVLFEIIYQSLIEHFKTIDDDDAPPPPLHQFPVIEWQFDDYHKDCFYIVIKYQLRDSEGKLIGDNDNLYIYDNYYLPFIYVLAELEKRGY